jgi:hypothetical protein
MRGKLLRAHFCEHDHWQGKPLYEAVVEKCREMGIAGVTVFRGLEGYGESCEMHRAHLIGHHQPILVVAGDTPENIDRLVPVLESMMETGMIAVSEVEMVRVTASG